MPTIHSTSVVDDQAELADDVEVGPFCLVGPHVTIGPRTKLISHVAIHGRTQLGANNRIWTGAILGGDPQDLKYRGEETELVIGDDNQIRECVTIHLGTANGSGVTRIGSGNLLMAYVHVGHDSVIADHCIVANAVQLAGHIHLESHAAIGGASALHHFVTVGTSAYVAGMTRVVRDVPPYMVVEGNPARVRKVNTVGLARQNMPEAQINLLKKAHRTLYNDQGDPHTDPQPARLEQLENAYPDNPHIAAVVNSLRRSADGVFGRYREALRQDNPYHAAKP